MYHTNSPTNFAEIRYGTPSLISISLSPFFLVSLITSKNAVILYVTIWSTLFPIVFLYLCVCKSHHTSHICSTILFRKIKRNSCSIGPPVQERRESICIYSSLPLKKKTDDFWGMIIIKETLGCWKKSNRIIINTELLLWMQI